MLETYITPLLMSYVDKYIKNLKPSDLSLSIWGGDVVLYNLELKLDVIEKELQLPITFLSGKIHKLQIHVPWTKLGSEPVEVTINTLECVVQLCDPTYKPEDTDNSSSVAMSRVEAKEALEDENLHDRGEPPPPGYVQSLVNRVGNNISLCVHNVILKYVEDDIVLSLNVKSAETFSVNANWEKAFVDIVAPDYVLRKVCNISDLTICLDKKSTSGTIDLYQDPLLYRCGLSCRVNINYDAHLRPKETMLNVYCECLDVTLTDQQLPMFVRLIKLCISLYYGSLDLPGCNYKPHPAADMIKQKKGTLSKRASISSVDTSGSTTRLDNANQLEDVSQDDWLNWMWSFVPESGQEDLSPEARSQPPDILLSFGIYVSQVTVTLKLTEKVSEGTFFGAQRFQFKPMLNWELSGVAVEVVMKGEEFFDAQLGVTSIMGWTLGDCVCNHDDELGTRMNEAAEEGVEKEEVILSIRAPQESPSEPSGFLVGSLFHNNDESTLELPELVFNMDKFLELHSEAHALKRYGAFFFDYLYTMEIEPEKEASSVDEDGSGDVGDVGKIRLVKEASHKRILVGPTHLQCTANFIHRLELIYELSFDGTPPRKEKTELFYDDFIEKQLLAGNIPNRTFAITLMSVTVTVPAADHVKADSSHLKSTSQDLLITLHSIHEQEKTDDKSHQPACIMHIDRMELQHTSPMYPTELSKLTMANADYPAGQNMLHHAYNDTIIKIFGVQLGFSYISSDNPDPPLINIMPSVSLIFSYKNCILPETWGNAHLKRNEAHLELPSVSFSLTKPQFMLLTHIGHSWHVTLDSQGNIPVLSKTLLGSVFDPEGSDTTLSKLEVIVTNTELQYCDTSAVMAASGSVGTLQMSVLSQGESQIETTPLVQGPTDTSMTYSGRVFRPSSYQDDPVECIGPVISLTIQLPRETTTSETTTVPLRMDVSSSVILLHLKGVAMCLDPLFNSWVSYTPSPAPSTSSSGTRVDKDPKQRHQSLRRTSAGTPRKKSFARGYGSVASPAKDKKSGKAKSGDKRSLEGMEGTEGRTFEAWLFDKLSIITSFTLQVDVRSITLFIPEKHVPHVSESQSIAHNYFYQSHNNRESFTFPSTLVVCLPTLKLHSANHTHVPVRQNLPLHLPGESRKDLLKKDTLPWILNAENLAVYSVHLRKTSRDLAGDPVVYSLVSPVGSTAVLASAKTSTSTSPQSVLLPHAGPHISRGSTRTESRRFPTLGFCVHTDFEPVIVSCSNKQIKLMTSLVESMFFTVVSQLPTADTTSGHPDSVPPTPGPALTRTLSLTSSAVDQVEQNTRSDTESTASFTQIQQPSNDVKVSLWLQWTLPRFVAHLYSRRALGHIPVCITADLEDLTAFIDYQETQLQMQYKVGAFNVTHSVHRDSSWFPGPRGGILFSCKDILSCKSSPFAASPWLSTSGSHHDSSSHGPHGFLAVIYKRSSLHLKRRQSPSERTGKEPVVEDCFKEQHEVKVSVQPFDVVLWTPAIVAAVDVFDLSLLAKFKFLSKPKPEHRTEKPDVLNLDKVNGDQSVTYSASLLPLLFVNMRDLRIFLPNFKSVSEDGENTIKATSSLSDDVIVVHLSTVCATPHPDNPNTRTVLNKDLHERFKRFGRSSRHALGYDLHEVQYQMDLTGFGVWSGRWKELFGNLNKEGDGTIMDQNPALEWNTQLWRSAQEVHIAPLVSGSDLRIVLAPAVSMEKSATLKMTTTTGSIPICGWSLEFNVITDVDCFLSKTQIQLLQGLIWENQKAVSSCALLKTVGGMTSFQTTASEVEDRTPFKPTTGDQDYFDSGIGSGQTDVTRKREHDLRSFPAKAKKELSIDQRQSSTAGIPWEVFLTARKVMARVYLQGSKERRRSFRSGSALSKGEVPGRFMASVIKPILQVEVIHPAVTINTQARGPRVRVMCYDVGLKGASIEQDWLSKALPEASDYTAEWFSTSLGDPDPHTGVLPSLMTVDVRNFINGAANVSIYLGRPIHMTLNIDILSEVTQFLDGVVVQSDIPSTPTGCDTPKEGTTSALKCITVATREISLEMATVAHPEDPKMTVSMAEIRGSARMKENQDTFLRVDANLDMEGLEVSLLMCERRFFLIKPFAFSSELEMIFSLHSLSGAVPSLPQICTTLDVGLIQVDFGQEHLNCICLLIELLQQHFASKPKNADENHEEKGDNKDIQQYGVDGNARQSYDDLRAGPFKYVTLSGEVELHHPEPYEIMFTTDSRDRPPMMLWKYPEPRALSAVEVLPFPFTSPVLVNTLNMGDELQVPCVLSYWDNLQKSYIMYKEFFISESSSCIISLPDPLTAEPARVIIADEWQMLVDATVDIEYPDDSSTGEEDAASSYSSPYRSLINATSLAASVKVNSVFSPSLIPAISAQVSLNMLEVKLINHTYSNGQVLPKVLDGYILGPSLPPEQEFLLFTLEGFNGVMKHLGGRGAATLVQSEFNCHCELLDYEDLTYRTLLSPFDVNITAALFHGLTGKPSEDQAMCRPVWLESGVEVGKVLMHVSQSMVHTAAVGVSAWTQNNDREADKILFSHYVICNDTQEAIRLGQVDTDESILLSSRNVLSYCWRAPRSVKADPRLHVCIEAEGDWRWSEPFDIDGLGVCSRTIHHKLHSATLFIDVRPLSGVQKQVIIRGGLQVTSRLSIGVDLQILKNPSLSSSHSEKATFQVYEDISLSPHTTLPSRIVSHAGLAGMRLRIPNTTTWSEALPLEYAERGDGKAQHLIVQLLGVKDFQTFYMWYNVDKTPFNQVQITLSPLFVMRSHLPEPVLMNVLTAKTNAASALQVVGKGREEEILDLAPNSWHHLTFQFASGGKPSNPSVPLNSTLIDLANRVNPDSYDEVETPLDKIWPYCNSYQRERQDDQKPSSKPSDAPLIRYVTSPGLPKDASVPGKDTSGGHLGVPPIPDIQLQCRVVKRWRDLSTLLIDIIPWCLLVNNTVNQLYVMDLDTDVVIELPRGQTMTPHRFGGKVQFGTTFPGSLSISWSEIMVFPGETQTKASSTPPDKSKDEPEHVTISLAHVTESSQPRAAKWVVTSRLYHGVRVVSVEEYFCIINCTGRPLVVYPALASSGKKVPIEVLARQRAFSVPSDCNKRVPIAVWDVASTSAVVLDEIGNAFLGETSPLLYLALEQGNLAKQESQVELDDLEKQSREVSAEREMIERKEFKRQAQGLERQGSKHEHVEEKRMEETEEDRHIQQEDVTTFSTVRQDELVLREEKYEYSMNDLYSKLWSQAVLVSRGAMRSMIPVTLPNENKTIPIVFTTRVQSGVVNVVVALDPSPRFVLHNDCPFTLQFGQATSPQSPSYRKGSPEKIVVVEQMDPLHEVPEVCAFSSMYYELPIMREWFKTSSDLQKLPEIHIQALYDVTVAVISEEAEAKVQPVTTTEVPQGWSYGFDINTSCQVVVNLPGRGRVLVSVSKSRLCTTLCISPYEDEHSVVSLCPEPSAPSFDIEVSISQVGICVVDEVSDMKKPYEILRATIDDLVLKHALSNTEDGSLPALPEFCASVKSFQLDNQLEDDLYEFSVIVTPSEKKSQNQSSMRKRLSPQGSNESKSILKVSVRYESGEGSRGTFLHSVDVALEPLTLFVEDTLIYRLVRLAESFLPPALESVARGDTHFQGTRTVLEESHSSLNPLMIGQFRIQPVSIHLTLHASVKLFVAMDDTPLSFGEFQVSPVYTQGSSFAQNVLYHYLSSTVFKVGWLLGSLELLGSPAGLIRSFSQGVADVFYLPYDGLTRGPSAFVSGMSRGMSSFVRHFSTGALTSVTNLASSISRNLDRLCMDEQHIRLLEEQRCRRPTQFMTGLTQGLSGFGLSLLGAVAGVVDQPIQGIQRASDMKQAASGVLTGVGKGLLGVVTKPLGGAMELVSQTGQGILQGTGLKRHPTRMYPVGESLVTNTRNSHLKYLWKVLHFQIERSLLLCMDVTVVTSAGHDYSGAILLTPNTLYIASLSVDAIQQTLNIRDTELRPDEEDNRGVVITTQFTSSIDDDVSDILETGDLERMKQFLRDTQTFAQTFAPTSSGESADSPESVFSSRCLLILDPLLRQTLISQFKSAKSKCIAETRL